MRSYLGITVHTVVKQSNENIELQRLLLSCRRFSGPHTGQQTAATLEDELESAEINEIAFIISDNASNMRSALTTAFLMPEQTTLTHYASDSENCLYDKDNNLFSNLSCEKADIEESLFPEKTFLFWSYTTTRGT